MNWRITRMAKKFVKGFCQELRYFFALYKQLYILFKGTTKKSIKCVCGKTNITQENFRSINLHIENGVNSFTKLLGSHCNSYEPMPDFTCEKCGKRGDTTITAECSHLPPVLIVQLNRYYYDLCVLKFKTIN